MNRFIVNMAVVKVNWDRSTAAPFLDNYLPLVIYTLRSMTADVVTVQDFKTTFEETADFSVPHNVALVLLNRAMKKYDAITRSANGTYTINRPVLPENDYITNRDKEEREFRKLTDRFEAYLSHEFNISIEHEEAGRYFFEILYQISPRLFGSALRDGGDIKGESEPHWKYSYLISRFIKNALEKDQESLDIVLSFVRGAMLTETFYYQAPEEIQRKIQDVAVYLDTSVLLDLFGYSQESQHAPIREMVSMLNELRVPLRCFDKTKGEIDAILHTTSIKAQQFGRIKDAWPGSVGEFFNRRGYKSSDIEIERNRIDDYLRQYEIGVVDAPAYLGKYGISEKGLDAAIKKRIPYQSDESRARDVDCIAAIFRLRQGKIKRRLLDCKAIFVTKNSALASSSTRFFNEQYGHSDTPLCIPDQVFTTLVWLKTANKAPNLPRERVVANCIAALQPSEEVWQSYASEAEKLLAQGNITENDYELLVHSTDSRLHLMDLTFGDVSKVVGTVKEVLERSKQEILSDTLIENEKLRKSVDESRSDAVGFKNRLRHLVENVVSGSLYLFSLALLIYGLTATWPGNFTLLAILPAAAILLALVLTVANLILGTYLQNYIRRISARTADRVMAWIEASK
ncbi:MAG: hypothetical protein GKR94_16430 [Gammaproteobacteria bacterium]|nr:hypothetical protein [Gammaproteobacteria bacterium]